jgi:hypothetical protein
MRLRLEFDVDYDLSGDVDGEANITMQELADKLVTVAHYALSEGMLTGGTSATVNAINACVRDLSTGELV